MPNPTEKDVLDIWEQWLDGRSVNGIARYADHGPAAIRKVLAAEPPETVRADIRYVLGCRAFWIATTAPGQDSLAFAFTPRRYNSQTFRKAFRAMRREFREANKGYDFTVVIEGIEVEVALKFHEEKGHPAWTFDETGSVTIGSPRTSQETPKP